MFAPIIAAIITLVGLVGFVTSGLVGNPTGEDGLIFYAGFLAGGPLIFVGYVIVGLCKDFASTNQIPEGRVAVRVTNATWPRSTGAFGYEGLPEGLRRERKGPLDPGTGRANKI